ncbi:uncharacterized protein LOC112896492 [Panicum hallii]|uniref:uncharacterized protein LOC112896492 n=1 Tax=Panicum hallii TaxID=206008 RepID=UPI000DF4DD49|nr:uncharacterized protein LOC112896492 [Panicum hallii]
MVGNYSGCLCIRASRIWDFYDPRDETKLLHIDLVLIDKEGNSIHAQIYPPITEMFKPLIKEGSVYNISFIQVKKSNRMYKPVKNDIIINFTRWTTVEEVVEVPTAFPVITYSLTPIDKLPSHVEDREYFTDVIGTVTGISGVSPVRPRSQQADTLKRTVTIRDASNVSLDVVLWVERATSFPAEQLHKDGQNSPQIVIFVGTLVRSYAVTLAQQLAYNEPNTFVAEHRKVSDIKYLHPFTNKKTEWLVTVKVMKIDKSWWYNSCKKCLKTAKPHGNTFKCTNHTCNTIGAINPRYKLAITAGDETGDTEFILFGRIAQRLIKRTVDALIADNPPRFIPDEITRLLEKVFTFNVSFTENTISSGNVSFQVNAIVAEIDDGNPLPLTPIGSQSSSLVLSQSAGSSVQATPEKDITFTLTSPATRTKRARSPAAL